MYVAVLHRQLGTMNDEQSFNNEYTGTTNLEFFGFLINKFQAKKELFSSKKW